MGIRVRKIFRVILYVLAAIIALLGILLLLIRMPAVQTRIAQKITSVLSKELNTRIDISAVAINFVDNATIKGIYLEDLDHDTLLYAGDLTIDIGFFKLLSGDINIESVGLENAVVHLKQGRDSIFNFQFIADRFASKDTVQTESKPLSIEINSISLRNIRARADLLSGSHGMQVQDLEVDVNGLDLEKMVFDIASVEIDQLHLVSRLKKQPPTAAQTPRPASTGAAFAFPFEGLPISLRIAKVDITESSVFYQNGDAQGGVYFTPDFVNAKHLNIGIEDILLDSTGLSAAIERIALHLNNRFDLQSLSGNIAFNDRGAQLENFAFNTLRSRGELDVTLKYPGFAAFMQSIDAGTAMLDMDSVRIALQDVAYFVPTVDTMSVLRPFKYQALKLDGYVSGSLKQVLVEGLNASISETSLDFDGAITNARDMDKIYVQEGALSVRSTLREISKIVDLKKYRPGIDQFGTIDLQAHFSGSPASLSLSDFSLLTDGKLQAQLSGTIKNLNDIERIAYDLQIESLASGYQDARVFVDSLPALVEQIKDLNYSGTISGTKTNYKLKGTLATTVGNILANLDMRFNPDFSNAAYSGTLSLVDFNLRQLLGNDSLGKVSLNASVDGSGISLEQLKTSLKLKVDRLDFNSYTYTNLNVQGEVDRKQFEGQVNIRDKNIAFQFKGLVNLNDSLPVLNFDAQLDTLDLYALHLSTFPLLMRWDLDAKMLGSTPDNVEGEVTLRNIRLSNADKNWRADSIQFSAESSDGDKRHLRLNAPFAQMDVSGKYKVANLAKIVVNFADQYFPFSNLIGGKQPTDVLAPAEEKAISDEKFNFSLYITDPTDIAQLFNIDLKRLDSARLSFGLDAPGKLINFELYIPEVEYGSFYIDSIYGFADNSGDQLAVRFSVDSIRLTETISIPSLRLEALMSQRRAVISTYVEGDSSGYNLGLTTILNAPQNDIELTFDNPLYLNESEWQITQSKPYNLTRPEKSFPVFELSSKGQKLSISGDTTQVALGFEHFDLNTLFGLVKIDSTQVEGLIDGDLKIGISESNPLIIGDLIISDIAVNAMQVGNLALKAEKNGAAVKAAASLSGNETDIRSIAQYNLDSKKVDGQVNIRALHLEPFAPFIKAYAEQLSGYLQGDLDIGGTVENPDLAGTLRFNEVSALILATGTTYGIQSGSLSLSEGRIQPDITMIDSAKRTATLKGSITHEYFRNMAFDLQFRADHFTFLNSAKNSDALFYGKFVAAVDADISGNIDLPKIRATLTTRPETDMTVQLISPEVVLNQESYMIFVDGVSNYSQAELDSITRVRYQVNSGIDLLMNVNLTDDATMRIVTDPITGDNLEIKGNSQLVVKVPENGALSITGVYEVKSGNYRFSYQNLLKRNFELLTGSRIVFLGDPMNSRLDLKAKYTTLASTLPLLGNDLSSLSEAESNAMRKRAEVSILLSIAGKLSQPELKFDIQIPEDNNGPVGSSVSQALERLRSNESDINREVFSILLFNSFSGSSSTGNISATGSATAIRSIGNLINTQLNKLAGNIEGFQIDFGLNQYQDEVSQGGGSVTQLDLGASQSLFNDRIVVSVGSNIDLESGNSEREGLSGITGDFVLEYKLTDSGKYRVKVFQKSDYDALNSDNLWKTGVGFSYKSKFSKKKKKHKTQ